MLSSVLRVSRPTHLLLPKGIRILNFATKPCKGFNSNCSWCVTWFAPIHWLLPTRIRILSSAIKSCTGFNSKEMKERVIVTNNHGEKLVGVLDNVGSTQLVVLCHGFRSSKDDGTLVSLASSLSSEGISAFRFDFSGNGESEGQFLYGNYWKDAEDLRVVVVYFRGKGHKVNTIIGHSKGGNAVLLYASKYQDMSTAINISGRFALDRGIDGRLGKDFKHRINQYGFIDVKDKSGNVLYRVTKESLMDRLLTDTKSAVLSIPKSCRVLTIHGSRDEIVPVTDAFEFDKFIANHQLHVIDEADHNYTRHQNEVAYAVLKFIKASWEASTDKIDHSVPRPTRGNLVSSKL